MLSISKHKFIKVALGIVALVFLTLGLKTPAYAAPVCGPGETQAYYGSTLTCVPQGTQTGPSSETTNPQSSSDSSGTVATCDDGSVAPLNNKDNCQTGGPHCGDAPGIHTSISIGCEGKGNPVMDMLFAIIRFLSMGVGIVVVASLIVAGVQYSASGGDPQAAQAAMKRIRSSLTALLIFIFAYAILNYVLPGAVLG